MVKVKICGLTNLADYNAAIRLGADYTGFIFYPQSPRALSSEKAAKIIRQGMQGSHQKIGVFVNDSIERIRSVYEEAGLDIVQLHGDESPHFCRELGLPYWKAIRIQDEHSLNLIQRHNCRFFLLDTFKKNTYGGTGIMFDLNIGTKAIQTGKKIIISGGVSASNINRVITLNPFAVDVNSSIEDKPGRKNPKKMEEFFNKIKNLQEEHHVS